jgi:hypothetical protein
MNKKSSIIWCLKHDRLFREVFIEYTFNISYHSYKMLIRHMINNNQKNILFNYLTRLRFIPY